MTTYESALFKVWNLPKATDDKIVKLKASVFDAAWILDEEDHDDPDDRLLVTAVLDTEYNINVSFLVGDVVLVCRRQELTFLDFQIYHNLQLNQKISKQVPDSGKISQLCVCPVSGHVIYAYKNGIIALLHFEDFSSHILRKIPCKKVIKLKVFSSGATTAVLLLVEKTPRKFTLMVSIDTNLFR